MQTSEHKETFHIESIIWVVFVIVQALGHVWLFVTNHGLQHNRLLCPPLYQRVCSNSYPLSPWCYPTISSCHPFLLLPSIFPSIRVFSNETALHIRWLKYCSFSFSISPSNEYSGLISVRINWLVWSPCSPKDSQESSKAPQFKSINSSVLSLLYGPTLTSIHDYWKNHSFYYMDLCQQSNISTFNMLSRFVIAFLPRSKRLYFMASVTVHSDFGAWESITCHCFYFLPFYLPWSDGTKYHNLHFLMLSFS